MCENKSEREFNVNYVLEVGEEEGDHGAEIEKTVEGF